MSLHDVCVFIPSWFGVVSTIFLGLLTYECTRCADSAVPCTNSFCPGVRKLQTMCRNKPCLDGIELLYVTIHSKGRFVCHMSPFQYHSYASLCHVTCFKKCSKCRREQEHDSILPTLWFKLTFFWGNICLSFRASHNQALLWSTPGVCHDGRSDTSSSFNALNRRRLWSLATLWGFIDGVFTLGFLGVHPVHPSTLVFSSPQF